MGWDYKQNPNEDDFMDNVMDLLSDEKFAKFGDDGF